MLTDEQKQALIDHMNQTSGQEMQQRMDAIPDRMTPQLLGQGQFRDTGRASTGPAEAMDSIVGAPARQAISQAQQGNFNFEGLKKTLGQVGADPTTAPTGYDIASKATDNPYLGAAMATSADLASLPIPGMQPGIVGAVDDVGSTYKAAAKNQRLQALLDSIKQNPNRPIAVHGPIDMNTLQKMGHTGPVIFKGKK